MEMTAAYVGTKIKFFRKLKSMSITELANTIHKSKSTLSKYENGQITIDIQSLDEIATALDVDIRQFFDYKDSSLEIKTSNISNFFKKDHFYIYYYDGRTKSLVKSFMTIQSNNTKNIIGCTFYMDVPDFDRCDECSFYYIGELDSFDLITYCTLINQINPMERLGMSILNPFHHNATTWGMMFGISYKPIAPFALKFLLSSTPLKESELNIEELAINGTELKMMKNLNMMLLE